GDRRSGRIHCKPVPVPAKLMGASRNRLPRKRLRAATAAEIHNAFGRLQLSKLKQEIGNRLWRRRSHLIVYLSESGKPFDAWIHLRIADSRYQIAKVCYLSSVMTVKRSCHCPLSTASANTF